MRSTLLRLMGAMSLGLGMVGACGGDESADKGTVDPGPLDAGPLGQDAPTGMPSDGGAEDTGTTDAGDGGDGGAAHPVVGYTVLGQINYAFTCGYRAT